MKYFILTHKNNIDFAKQTQEYFKNIGIDTELIVGETIDNEKYTRTTVLMWNWIQALLPKCIECNEHVCIFEDDCRIVKPLCDLPFDDYDIIWFGYRKGRLEHKRKTITGTQAIYFKKEVLKDLYDNFNQRKRKIHLDNGMSQFCVKIMDKYKIKQPKLSYCYEEEHESLISLDNWRTYTKPKLPLFGINHK